MGNALQRLVERGQRVFHVIDSQGDGRLVDLTPGEIEAALATTEPVTPNIEIEPENVMGGSLDVPAVADELESVRERAAFYRARQERFAEISRKAAEMAAQCEAIADGHDRTVSALQRYVPG